MNKPAAEQRGIKLFFTITSSQGKGQGIHPKGHHP